jgi:hypothetical protein
MKDFSHASFSPDTIGTMTAAMNTALSTLPHPLGSAKVQFVAESVLRSTQEGERDPAVLARMALLELLLTSSG